MNIQLKNKHIFFATERIWQFLHYKLKTQINALVVADSADDKLQTIDISKDNLLSVFQSVSSQPEGVAAKINQEILGALLPQIMAASNEVAVTAGEEQPNEALLILMGIQAIDVSNKNAKEAKILNGKNQILA